MNRIVLSLTVTGLLFFSCKKSKEPPADYLIFGTFSQGCITGCQRFFQISNDRLYAALPHSSKLTPEFSPNSLPADQYEIAHELLEDLPEYLQNSSGQTFGCPNCFDQGGIYLELRQNGVVRKWDIDPAEHPSEINAYVLQIASVTHQLGN